jgi:hypothetical protein
VQYGIKVLEAGALYRTSPNLTEGMVAIMLGCSVHALRRWRWNGEGPRFYKIGRNVRYRPCDLDDFIAERARRSTSDQGGAA